MRFYPILLGLCAGAALTLAEEPAANKQTLSLDDCLKMALEKNLDVRIQRLGPDIAKFNISAAYAGYDPTLNLSGQHNFSLSPSTYNSTFDFTIPGQTSDANTFSSSLGGTLPTGMRYNIGSIKSSLSESYGINSKFNDKTGLIEAGSFDSSQLGVGISLTQPLLKNFWIDSTRMNIQIAKKNLKYSELTLRQQIMNTVNSVEQAYYGLIYALENVKVQEKALELSKQLLRDNQYRVKIGVLAPLDEKSSESQVASDQASLIAAQQILASQQNVLKKLIDDNFSKWEKTNVEPSTPMTAAVQVFSLQDSWRKGLTLRPDMLQARIDLEKQDITLRYNRNQLFPELDLIGSYGHAGSGREFSDALGGVREGNSPSYMYGAQLIMPLSNKGARSQYKIGKAQKQQLVLQLKKLEQDIMVQIDDAVKQATSALQQLEASREARRYAEAALDAELKKLENGKSTPYLVLQYQRDLTRSRSQEIMSLRDYNRYLAQLSLIEGSILDRNNLTVQVK